MVYTHEAGQAGSPAIVFLHGGGLSGRSWLPVMEHLEGFHCLAPDLPGTGHSRDLTFTIDGAAAETAEVIRQRVPSARAHLVALSLGGPVALTLLRVAPELADHVMLSGSSGHFSRLLTGLGKATSWMYRLYKPDYLLRETMRRYGIAEAYADLVVDDLRRSMDPAFVRAFMGELSRWVLPERVDRPLLLAVGQKEPWGALGISRGYLRRYPGARGVIVPGALHAWSLQSPDLFARVVRAWVTDAALPEELSRIPFG